MRKYIIKITGFIISLILFFSFGLLSPTTPRASKSMLMASLKKDSLLQYTDSPRILFVGGSNLSFGLNSEIIRDSLKINPINTGIHAGLGLKYMLDDALLFIKQGDIVVLVPEYSQFYYDYNHGTEELLRIVFDANIERLKILNIKQIINILHFIPKYTLSKFNPKEYINSVEKSDIYGVNSFNKYGDTYTHWEQPSEIVKKSHLNGEFHDNVMKGIINFEKEIKKRNAVLYISFPCFQEESFIESIKSIDKIKSEYIKNNFTLISEPEQYMMNDSLIFNTVYHLNKKGVELRTRLLINDLKKALLKNSL